MFTNLTHDHLDAHGSPEHYLASKAQLFLSLPPGGTAVLNASDESYEALSSAVPEGVRELTYGVPWRGELRAATDVCVTKVAFDWHGTRVDLALSANLGGGSIVLRAPAAGEIFAENAIAAWLGAVAAGVPAAVAAEAIGNARPPPGRFEVIAERPWVVIDYAHTPDALKRTLQTARTLCTGALWVVFGAGGNRDRAKRGPMGEAASLADRVVLTADNPRDEDPEAIAASIRSGIRSSLDVEVILDRREAIASSVRRAAPDDVIVIAGRGHETDQIIGPEHVALSDADVARAAVAARSPSVIETFFRLEVRDMARARAFYAEAFGATLVFEYPGWSSLRIAGVRVGLVLSVEHAPCRTGLHFTVGDLATARAAVDRAGGRAPAAPIEVAPGVVMADVTDTEGKTFALMLS